MSDIPKTRYAKSSGINIAYQVIGQARLDLVYVPGWLSNVEMMWENPMLARFLRRLASFSRLIVFDKRGTGLSDRDPSDRAPLLEERVDDIVAVMDAARSTRAAIMGISETAAMSLLFAATHPERTTAVIAYGSYTNGRYAAPRAYPWTPTSDQNEWLQGVGGNWGPGGRVIAHPVPSPVGGPCPQARSPK